MSLLLHCGLRCEMYKLECNNQFILYGDKQHCAFLVKNYMISDASNIASKDTYLKVYLPTYRRWQNKVK